MGRWDFDRLVQMELSGRGHLSKGMQGRRLHPKMHRAPSL
jgi:hypothetical protein